MILSLVAVIHDQARSGSIYESSNRVGIGTESPGSRLDVAGSINTSGEFRMDGYPILNH